MKSISMNIQIRQIICSAVFLFLFSCAPRIAGYSKGDRVTDPATGISRPVCSWELRYRLKDKKACMRAKYNCSRGERVFGTWRGCGCAKPVFCRPVP